MSATGALPSYITPHGDDGPGAPAMEEITLSTVNVDGDAYSRVSVLWVEVDGERVLDDRWGVGEIDELRFKVGVRAAGDARLLVGEEEIPLHPTDSLTIRDFRGRFTFENVGTPDAAIALDGTVKSTSVKDGAARRVTTEFLGDGPATQQPATSGDDVRVRHVVLDANGVETVGVERGDGRPLATETAEAGRPRAVNIYANHVKVNGRTVTEYLHGEGALGSVEFEVAYHGGDPFLLNWSNEATELKPGTRVRVTDFVGTYLVFQVQNGVSRVRLDGYANDASIVNPGAGAAGASDGNSAPVAAFSHTPQNPTTSQWVTFSDASYDPDGVVVLYQWTFGDGETSTTRNPRHRYAEPGAYTVTLTVTDEGLRSNQTEAVIMVGNTPPVSDFDFTPTTPTDVRPVAFNMKAWDPDGEVVAYHWDFGDGNVSTDKSPKHTYADDGQYDVTLTVTDDQGGSDAITKVVAVQNVPPIPDFTITPQSPLSLETVRFTDASSDPDGAVQERHWTFGSSEYDTGAVVNRTYDTPGERTVTLTVVDDDGDTASVTKTFTVRNRAPEAAFDWVPSDPVTGASVQFQDQSADRDGTLTKWRWNFGDGNTTTLRHPGHAYGARGTYDVTLTVTDDRGANHTATETITVGNAPPQADFDWGPATSPYDQTRVLFTDQSSDADGPGTIVQREWSFGDGNTTTETDPEHTYADDGAYTVTLTVTDDRGVTDTATKTINVRNRPPQLSASYSPSDPTSRTLIEFFQSSADVDGTVVDAWWELPNGTRLNGSVVEARLPAGDHTVVAAVADDDGAVVETNISVHVDLAGPIADFTFSPDVPSAGRPTQFVDASDPGDRPIVVWSWSFGDGNFSNGETVTHTFSQPGEYTVRLEVRDEGNDGWSSKRKTIRVNAPPTADFNAEPLNPSSGQRVWFNASAGDPDGYVTSYEWDFGDGTNASGARVTHAYTESGVYDVTLTTTDNDGTTTSTTSPVVVANKAPKPDFTVDTPAVANATVAFFDQSTDPDSNITAWRWDFGDGATSTQQDPTHAYTASATYPVRLEVEDDHGAKASITKNLRVLSDHAVNVTLTAVYPDGYPVDLTLPDYEVVFTVTHDLTGDTLSSSTSGGSTGDRFIQVTQDGQASGAFASGEWAGGDTLTVRVTAPDGSAVEASMQLHHTDHAVSVGPLVLRLPSRATVTMDAADEVGVLSSPNATADGYPVYHDPTEAVTGIAKVVWTNGNPVPDARISVRTAYLGPNQGGAPLTSLPVQLTASANAKTNATGVAKFTAPAPTRAGVYLPGWYQVDIQTSIQVNGEFVVSHARTYFFEDGLGALSPDGVLP